jgi:hypothetical protein
VFPQKVLATVKHLGEGNFFVNVSAYVQKILTDLNSLNAELNTICHLLALFGAHHILHVSRIRVKHLVKNNYFFKVISLYADSTGSQ